MLEDEKIEQIIKETQDLQTAVETLVSLANQNGGKDNIAIILIKI